MDKKEFALKYAQKGWHVLPLYYITSEGICSCSKGKECRSPGKHPLTKNGYKDATTDTNQITKWWTKFPKANIGIATGKVSGLIVIDIDPRHGGNENFEFLVSEYGEVPTTYEIKTGGNGRHLYFQCPKDMSFASKLISGVDIKSDGGYVVAPPSNHISGEKYARLKANRGNQIAKLTETWKGALRAKKRRKKFDFNKDIPKGSRNETLFKRACSLRARGLQEEEILTLLFNENEKRCKPPLEEDELRSIIISTMRYEEEIEWTTPKPLINLSVPDFPIEVFPKSIRKYLKSVAEVYQVPIEMPTCVLLSIFALALAGKIKVKAKDAFIEDCNLFIMISAETATRKSTVFKEMMGPIEEYQIAENKVRAVNIVEYKNKKEMLDQKIKRLKDDFARNKKGISKSDIEKEIKNLEQQKVELEEVFELTLYTQDFTPEVVADLLSKNLERLGILSSEGDLIDILKGRYNSDGEISLYLKGYTGDFIKVHRMGRNSISLAKPLLTILVMAQPIVIEEVLSNEQYHQRGFTGRILYCIAKNLVGSREYSDKSIPETLRTIYSERVKKLLSYKENKTIEIEVEAKEAFILMANKNEKSLVGINQSIREWANRRPGFVLRIAAILHSLEWLESGKKEIAESINVHTMKNAIKVVDYFTEHSRIAFEQMGYNQAIAEAKIILKKVIESGEKELLHNQIYNLCRGQNRFREAKSIDKGLQVLCEKEYLKRIDSIKKGVGRPPGHKYIINPNV